MNKIATTLNFQTIDKCLNSINNTTKVYLSQCNQYINDSEAPGKIIENINTIKRSISVNINFINHCLESIANNMNTNDYNKKDYNKNETNNLLDVNKNTDNNDWINNLW